MNLISNTKTRTGLEVRAVLDENIYDKGIKISDEEMEKINIYNFEFHAEWNYEISHNRNEI